MVAAWRCPEVGEATIDVGAVPQDPERTIHNVAAAGAEVAGASTSVTGVVQVVKFQWARVICKSRTVAGGGAYATIISGRWHRIGGAYGALDGFTKASGKRRHRGLLRRRSHIGLRGQSRWMSTRASSVSASRP